MIETYLEPTQCERFELAQAGSHISRIIYHQRKIKNLFLQLLVIPYIWRSQAGICWSCNARTVLVVNATWVKRRGLFEISNCHHAVNEVSFTIIENDKQDNEYGLTTEGLVVIFVGFGERPMGNPFFDDLELGI